jgi:hypothetical protein
VADGRDGAVPTPAAAGVVGGMPASLVVPGDPAEDRGSRLCAGAVAAAADQLDLEDGKERLGDRVVQARPGAAHGTPQPQPFADVDTGGRGVLAPTYSLSVWKMVAGILLRPRVATAAWSASPTRPASCRSPIDQPSRCREARASSDARYSQPSSVGMKVRWSHQATSIRSGSNSRPSRSGAGGAAASGLVRPRRRRGRWPTMPWSAISRSTRLWFTRQRRRRSSWATRGDPSVKPRRVRCGVCLLSMRDILSSEVSCLRGEVH